MDECWRSSPHTNDEEARQGKKQKSGSAARRLFWKHHSRQPFCSSGRISSSDASSCSSGDWQRNKKMMRAAARSYNAVRG